MALKKDAEAQPIDELSFEDAIERLEQIVEELEGGELSLEQSLRHYEEGMKLSKRLSKTLDEAEKSVERLIEGGEEGDPAASDAAPKKARKPGTRPMTLDLGAEGGGGELPF